MKTPPPRSTVAEAYAAATLDALRAAMAAHLHGHPPPTRSGDRRRRQRKGGGK